MLISTKLFNFAAGLIKFIFNMDINEYLHINANDGENEFTYTTVSGVYTKLTLGEDGITVNLRQPNEPPKIGTFTSMELAFNVIRPFFDNDEFRVYLDNVKIHFS